MAEVLVEFDAVFPRSNGAKYAPRACARPTDGGLWEGWIEFGDLDTGDVVRTARETTQPLRDDVMYWATGLTRVYLEGALERSLAPANRPERLPLRLEPTYDGPAPAGQSSDRPGVPHAVLDPFQVFAQGERVLRQELSALDLDHLRAIARAFGLDAGVAARSRVPEVLIEHIVAEVRAR